MELVILNVSEMALDPSVILYSKSKTSVWLTNLFLDASKWYHTTCLVA